MNKILDAIIKECGGRLMSCAMRIEHAGFVINIKIEKLKLKAKVK